MEGRDWGSEGRGRWREGKGVWKIIVITMSEICKNGGFNLFWIKHLTKPHTSTGSLFVGSAKRGGASKQQSHLLLELIPPDPPLPC